MKRLSVPPALALALVLLSPVAANAQSIEEKAQICTACHGEAGVPAEQPFPVPVIWGQNLGYLFFQLRDFKTGARKNDQMTPIADALDREDLMPLATIFLEKAVAQSAAETAAGGRSDRSAARQRLGRLHQLPSGRVFRATAPSRASPARSAPICKRP